MFYEVYGVMGTEMVTNDGPGRTGKEVL